LTFETYIFELILIPAPPIKMYANGAFQAAQFIESSAAGPAMKMNSNNLVQVGKMIELPAIIGATQNLFFSHNNTGTVPVPPGSVGDLLILAASGSSNTDIPTFPTGFTQISANLDMTSANNTHYNGYYTIFAIKTADGTESGNFTITWNTFNGDAILCVRVAGVGSTLLANTTNSNVSYFTTTTTTVNTTITTPSNNNFIVAIGTWEYPGSNLNGVSMPSIFNQTMAIPTPNPSNGSPSNYYWVSGGVQPTAGTQTYPFTGNFPVVQSNYGGVALLAFPLSIPASTQKLYSNGAFVSSQFIE
jgi:hypothetical protein